MRAWTARILAAAAAAVAIALVVFAAHAPRVSLEASLGAAVVCTLSLVFLWRRLPSAAAVLNVCCTAAAVAVVLWSGHAPASLPAERGQAAQPGRSAAISGQPAAQPLQPGTSSQSTEVVQPPGDVAASVQVAAQQLKPEEYLLEACARQLPTIDAAFAWVRDKIRYESYDGILRGARGTLHTRAGNAADRAMLLAAVLEANRIPVRLATGRLPPPDAERLYARIFEQETTTAPPSARGPIAARIFARAQRDNRVMLAALGHTVPATTAPSRDEVLKEIERHVWVRAQRDGQWVDLDPSFPDSRVGQSYASVQDTYESPPASLMQQVTFRVVVETLSGGALARDVALEYAIPAYQLLDRQVYLAHQVYQPFNGQGGDLQFIFGNKDVQQPLLYVNGSITTGKAIDFGAGASAAGAAPPNAARAAADAFGGPAPGSANPGGTAFVAEWLEFEIAFPDGRRDVTRRALVDRAGTAWRHAAAHDAATLHDLARAEGELVAPQALHNIWFSAGKHDLLALAQVAKYLSAGSVPSRHPEAPTFEERVWPFAMRNVTWFLASDHIVVPAINDVPGLRFYADSPRIFVWSVGPDPSGPPGSAVVQSDLRRDVLRGVAKDAAAQAAISHHRLWFGALEGALEHELSVPPGSVASTELVTTSSLADSGRVVLLGPGSSAAARDPETQARLQTALAAGDTLIVPEQVLAGGVAGWWEIARQGGDLHAVLDDDLDGSINRFPKPPPGGTPQRYNPINWNGERQSYYARLEQEFEPEEVLYQKCLASVEAGEDCGSSGQVIRQSGKKWVGIAAAVAATGAVADLLWEILK